MHGLYLLWWVGERGLSPALVATILAAGDLALLGFEVPTGWFADRFGHRASLIVGSSVQVLGMLACWLGRGIPELIVASVLVALGDAFRSGADEALLYRTCVALRREDDFQTIEARTRASGLVALVVLLLAGGLIVARWGFAVGWAVETALCALGLAIACAMVEPPAAVDDQGARSLSESEREPRAERARRLRTVAVLVAPAALLDGVASAASFLAQTTGDGGPEAVTILVAAITIAEAAGAAIAGRLSGPTLRGQWLLAAIGAIVVAASVALPAGLLIASIGLAGLLGLALPLRATLLQRLAADQSRARAASLASACDMACSALALMLAGSGRSRRAGH
ncbi:MAG TPA: MFS transporter [Vicinamibacterales bacterium]|nr:MFS transporter [Vicinamibacterales bacterium]